MTATAEPTTEGMTLDDTVVTDEYTIGCISKLDRTGDTRHMWDSRNRAETNAAKAMFDSLKKEGYMIYKAKGKDGKQGDVMHEFDETAERLIAVKPIQGG